MSKLLFPPTFLHKNLKEGRKKEREKTEISIVFEAEYVSA